MTREADDPDGEPGRWLREMVDDRILGLFSDEAEDVRKAARRILAVATDDPSVVEELTDALRTSILEGNDDTQGSLWIAILLGEIGDRSALPILILGLGSEDEPLQEASRDGILRMGAPGVDALIEELEGDPGPELLDAGYRLLGYAGSLGDPGVRERAMDFLAERVEREAAKPSGECKIESLFQAGALLGDRRMLEAMDRVLRTRFKGNNAAIQDSREMLAENAAGEPLVFDSPPWIEEHRWLFEEDLDRARVKGRKSTVEEGEGTEERGGEENPGERSLSSLYWGLGGISAGDEDARFDARRFLENPSESTKGKEDPEDIDEDEDEDKDKEDRE
jgi:hypothetical protein